MEKSYGWFFHLESGFVTVLGKRIINDIVNIRIFNIRICGRDTPTGHLQTEKQECDRRISEVQEQIEQSKAEKSIQSVVPGTVRAAVEQAGNFLNGTRLTAK